MLIHLNRYAKSEEVLAEMERLNLRPTSSPETLAFATMHSDVQRKFPLIGLGSVWISSDSHRNVLCMDKCAGKRDVCLGWYESGWYLDCRFLAVCT